LRRQQYGLITVGEAHVYMVKGSGKIINVNTETSLGTIEVALDGYDGPIKVLIYMGLAFPATRPRSVTRWDLSILATSKSRPNMAKWLLKSTSVSYPGAWQVWTKQLDGENHFLQGRVQHPHI
jgi:hypothetical protein